MAKAAPSNEGRRANRRGAARLAAVQALYQMDLAATPLNEILGQFEAHWIGREVEGRNGSRRLQPRVQRRRQFHSKRRIAVIQNRELRAQGRSGVRGGVRHRQDVFGARGVASRKQCRDCKQSDESHDYLNGA